MLIKSEFRVFESVALDDSRPTLSCVNVTSERLNPDSEGRCEGLAMATDGFILAVVPVLVDDLDDLGLVSAVAFKAAFAAARRMRVDPVVLKLDLPLYVGLADGSMVRRYGADVDAGSFSRFPDVDPVIPKRSQIGDREVQGRHLMSVAYNPGLINRLCKSIGCKIANRGVGSKGDNYPRLVFGGVDNGGSTCDPIVIESQSASMADDFVPPFGLIMPMHSSGGDYWRQE